MVDVNCGALPENLMESESFGHETDAFSRAHSVKQGLFELASTGTTGGWARGPKRRSTPISTAWKSR